MFLCCLACLGGSVVSYGFMKKKLNHSVHMLLTHLGTGANPPWPPLTILFPVDSSTYYLTPLSHGPVHRVPTPTAPLSPHFQATHKAFHTSQLVSTRMHTGL